METDGGLTAWLRWRQDEQPSRIGAAALLQALVAPMKRMDVDCLSYPQNQGPATRELVNQRGIQI